ncbi:MAG TPA: DUF4389 domain-containing protein [Dehalococcoidia bacterium]|jgi:hypothetical protein|nr:DUF4389 domain-containing protein [Dehalococcoidia bacterium]
MTAAGMTYPIGLEAYDPAEQDRLSVFLRIIYAIPQLIALYFVQIVLMILSILAWFAILFTGRYPDAFANFTAGGLRWWARTSGYIFLLTDQYPPFSLEETDEYPVRPAINIDLGERNRLTVFFRTILIIPHFVVVAVLEAITGVLLFIAWLVALFTGTVPVGIHNFIASFLRYSLRTMSYYQLATDEYPPFSLE